MSCTHCRADLPPGIYLCTSATRDLRSLLGQIPGVLADAEDTIAKLDQLGTGGGTNNPAAGSAAPINLEASTRARELWDAIHSWARTVLEDDSTPGLSSVEPTTYLKISVEQIRQREDSGEMLLDLSRLTSRLLNAIDLPPEKIHLGTCGAVYEGITCTDQITARTTDYETRCHTCGATHYVAQIQQDRAAASWGHYDTLANVVRFLRRAQFAINPKSAQRWAARGELPATQYRADGVALYSPGQIIDAHQRMQQRRGRPKRVA